MRTGPMTGMQQGLISCEVCGLLSRATDLEDPGHCPRCGKELAFRRPNAIQRTWALIVAAAICYVPANLLPIMSTTTPTYAEKDTILSGIIMLYKSGTWPLALIVLIASIIIPVAKIIALSYLLITVQMGSVSRRHERTRLYRLIEFVGRWSMIDVFVVTFVVALVQFHPLMYVEPAMGVFFFAAVVVLTMLAARTFEPRLIWDAGNESEDPHV